MNRSNPQNNWLTAQTLPDRFDGPDDLEELLSRPTEDLAGDLADLEGDLMILGVGGKVGPTLARLARRAAPGKRVVGVARFSDAATRARLEDWGVETIPCDLLDRPAVERLPKLPNVIFMAGRKFGTTGDEAATWAMNALCPAICAEALRASRLVAFSTLCIYPPARTDGPGSRETDPIEPLGEYANSCVARERVVQHFSKRHATPGRLVRLVYAIDMRYGLLNEVASAVWAGRPIDLTTGHANVIWQGDASEYILRTLCHCTVPASPLNIGSPANTSIRSLAEAFGRRLGKAPVFVNREAPTAWVTDCTEVARLLGPPTVSLDRMMDWTADWVRRGLPTYDKPTRYQVRDGRF
jgi:nucleoside-diphosphate-sugar epimerase